MRPEPGSPESVRGHRWHSRRGRHTKFGWPPPRGGVFEQKVRLWILRVGLRRMFLVWFVATTFTTLAVAWLAYRAFDGSRGFDHELERLKNVVGNRFGEVWEDRTKREELRHRIEDELAAKVSFRGVPGQSDEVAGCKHPLDVIAQKDGHRFGQAHLCFAPRDDGSGWRFVPIIGLPLMMLWIMSGRIARRLARPFEELVVTAERIQAGDLTARVPVRRGGPVETRILGEAFNAMAQRLAGDLEAQKSLLAMVSHELKTPLARLRFLLEMARDEQASAAARDTALTRADTEVEGVAKLVTDLLASSRVDFAALTKIRISVTSAALSALEATGAPPEILDIESEDLFVLADATLLARALINLLDNAQKHAGGPTHFVVTAMSNEIEFAIEDQGPGVTPGDETRVFSPFVGTGDARSTGLGLSLVARIASAHGGRVVARNLAGGGARFSMFLPKMNENEPKVAPLHKP